MTIPRLRILLSAALAGAILASSAALVGALFVLGLGVTVDLPWWLALAVPVGCYGFLAPLSLPRLPRTGQAVAAVALCAGQALLAFVSAAVVALVTPLAYSEALVLVSFRFFPAPILQILCTPLILVPFRWLIVDGPRQRWEPGSPRLTGAEGREAAPGPRTEGPAVEQGEPRLGPGGALAAMPEPDPKRLALERLSQTLGALASLDASVSRHGGVTLHCLCSAGLSPDVVAGAVAPMLPLLVSRLEPAAVEQVTVRLGNAALVLTPAGAVEGTRAVIAAAAPRSVALAPIGTLCLRAAAECIGPEQMKGSDAAGPAGGAGAELAEVAAGPDAELLAGALSVFGRFTPCVLSDREGSLELWLFVSPSENRRAIGAFAHRAALALAAAEPTSLGPVESALFRFGERRLVLRPAAGRPGQWIALVTAGASVDSGPALRQSAA